MEDSFDPEGSQHSAPIRVIRVTSKVVVVAAVVVESLGSNIVNFFFLIELIIVPLEGFRVTNQLACIQSMISDSSEFGSSCSSVRRSPLSRSP